MLLWKKWIFLCGLVGSNEKERIDMKLENACMNQEIVDKNLENIGMELEINTLTCGLQNFDDSDNNIRFYTDFQVHYSN